MIACSAIARALLRLWLVAALLLAPLTAGADVAVPPLKARVTDLTGTLDAAQKGALEQKLAAFEKRKGAQIAVLMLPTTQPETIEQYAVRVEEAWKLGRKGIDDGALLVVAKDDRKLRIETGYGLEGVLPDAIAKRIVSDDIVPRFKQGDFYGGINAGIDRMLGVIDGEPLPAPPAPAAPRGNDGMNNLLVIGFVLVFVVGGILRAIFGRFIGAGVVAGAVGFMAWIMSGTLIFALFAAIVAFILTLFGANSGGGSWGGGYSSGGGDFGGGGFSGGGGSSGGGGASGSW